MAGSGPGREGHASAARGGSAEVGFGPHLVFDGYGCPIRELDDLGRLYALLDSLPARIHMTKIMPPFPKHLARSRDWVVRDRRAVARSLGLEASS